MKKRKFNLFTVVILSILLLISSNSAMAYESGIASVTNESDFEFDPETHTITAYNGNDTSIVIPSNINGVEIYNIGAYTFTSDASSLDITDITVSEGIVNINGFAFSGCGSLAEIHLPSTIKSVEPDSFDSCIDLQSIIVNGDNNYFKSIDGVLFNSAATDLIQYPIGKSDKSYTIPETVTQISGSAFKDCNLESVIFPENLKTISDYAFAFCDKLTSINLPKKLEVIGEGAFEYCKFDSVVIPKSVTKIGNFPFMGNFELQEITIYTQTDDIGRYIFYSCKNISEVYCVCGSAFDNSELYGSNVSLSYIGYADKLLLKNSPKAVKIEYNDFGVEKLSDLYVAKSQNNASLLTIKADGKAVLYFEAEVKSGTLSVTNNNKEILSISANKTYSDYLLLSDKENLIAWNYLGSSGDVIIKNIRIADLGDIDLDGEFDITDIVTALNVFGSDIEMTDPMSIKAFTGGDTLTKLDIAKRLRELSGLDE